MSTPHPSFSELLDWLEGRLDDRQSADVADRVAHADQDTADTVAWIRSFAEGAHAMPLLVPPRELSAEIRSAVQERLNPWVPGEYVEAGLVYDSRTSAVAGGTRDASTSTDDDVFHLVFETEAGQIVLDVMHDPGGALDVQGSVPHSLDTGEVLPRVVFTSDLTVRRTVTCDGDGQFKVADLPLEIDEMWVMRGGVRLRAALRLDVGS